MPVSKNWTIFSNFKYNLINNKKKKKKGGWGEGRLERGGYIR